MHCQITTGKISFPLEELLLSKLLAHPRKVSRERSRCREPALQDCGVGSQLMESVFGDPSSFRNKPDTWRASQQLHQLTWEQRIVNCKLSHTLCLYSPYLLLSTSNLFLASPHCTNACRCSRLYLWPGRNKNAVKSACAWYSLKPGPLQISQRPANTLRTALQQSWADPVANSQTGPSTYQHLSDTTERLFQDCCRAFF